MNLAVSETYNRCCQDLCIKGVEAQRLPDALTPIVTKVEQPVSIPLSWHHPQPTRMHKPRSAPHPRQSRAVEWYASFTIRNTGSDYALSVARLVRLHAVPARALRCFASTIGPNHCHQRQRSSFPAPMYHTRLGNNHVLSHGFASSRHSRV